MEFSIFCTESDYPGIVIQFPTPSIKKLLEKYKKKMYCTTVDMDQDRCVFECTIKDISKMCDLITNFYKSSTTFEKLLDDYLKTL